MAKVRVNGVELYYEVAGQGHPVTFIHGFSGLSDTWDAQFADFSSRYRVIKYDIRGQGQSGINETGNSVENWTLDLYQLLRHLKAERTILVGHSMGAYISLKFTLDYPGMVKALVLVGVNAGLTNDLVMREWVKRMATVAASGVEALTDELPPFLYSPGFIEENPEHIARWKKRLMSVSELALFVTCTAYLARPSLTEELPKIKVPTLIFVGDKDIKSIIDAARDLNEGIPNSRLVVVPNSGHMVHEEQPQAFNSIVSEFLEGIQAG